MVLELKHADGHTAVTSSTSYEERTMSNIFRTQVDRFPPSAYVFPHEKLCSKLAGINRFLQYAACACEIITPKIK